MLHQPNNCSVHPMCSIEINVKGFRLLGFKNQVSKDHLRTIFRFFRKIGTLFETLVTQVEILALLWHIGTLAGFWHVGT